MNAWKASEEEELSVSIYAAVRAGLWAVQGLTPEGEALYVLTPLGMARARAGAVEYGYDPDSLTEDALIAIAGGLVR